ncbi:MAG: arginase family protein [Gemmatimonadota bacterium]
MSTIPHTVPGLWPPVSDVRFASRIETDVAAFVRGRSSDAEPALALLGLPDDTGVALNRGRVGAAAGPGAFRAALARYGGSYDLERDAEATVPVVDAGDVRPARGDGEEALLETHQRVEEAAAALYAAGLTPVFIGGGHDLTLPTVRAFAKAVGGSAAGGGVGGDGAAGGGSVGGINVDAHLDVRERVGSGMAFRRLLDEGRIGVRRFVTFGAARFVHEAEHVRWLQGLGATVIGVERARADESEIDRAFGLAEGRAADGRATESGDGGSRCFVTLDLDAIDVAHAPGVSATNPAGLDVRTVTAIAERAGRSPAVGHFDLMELSPPHDTDGRTARLAALLFLHFVAGFAQRPA